MNCGARGEPSRRRRSPSASLLTFAIFLPTELAAIMAKMHIRRDELIKKVLAAVRGEPDCARVGEVSISEVRMLVAEAAGV
jgi:hypothetical protein